jgi:hypothetical protein
MTNDPDLFGKTFDQQFLFAGEDVVNRDISPNRRIAGEIVFERLGEGVRVTARDEQHRVLWGYVGAKETVKQIHCLVAIYDTLQGLLGEELSKIGISASVEDDDPISAAMCAFDRLENTVKRLRDSLDVKKVTDATLNRARLLARTMRDAERQVTLDAGELMGI